jgi:hypothetical protein
MLKQAALRKRVARQYTATTLIVPSQGGYLMDASFGGCDAEALIQKVALRGKRANGNIAS